MARFGHTDLAIELERPRHDPHGPRGGPRLSRLVDDPHGDPKPGQPQRQHEPRYTQAQSFSPKVWNDAYLAVFARAANLQLVTFDQGFVQFADLNRMILSRRAPPSFREASPAVCFGPIAEQLSADYADFHRLEDVVQPSFFGSSPVSVGSFL